MTDRPAPTPSPDDAGAARPRASGKRSRQQEPVIWVPQGSSFIVSSGVKVAPMAATPTPPPIVEYPVRRRSRRRGPLDAPPRPGRSAARLPNRLPASSGPAPSKLDRLAAIRPGTGSSDRPHLPFKTLTPPKDWQIPAVWVDPGATPEAGWSDVAGAVTVPPEIESVAQMVMAEYDMKVSAMQCITTKPDKGGAIWRIETDKGPRSLKLLHRDAPRSLFSIGAQEYLKGKGARVPGLIRTRGGEYCVQVAGKLWIVTDWITPLTPATKIDLTGAAQLCYGLGEFHKWSQGYVPPRGATNASRLYRWPKTYQKVLAKIGWFREIAKAYSDMPASATLLSMVDTFEQQARDAIARLEKSAYADLVGRGEQHWGIVHQDYGWSNGQVGPDGNIWLIDLDGVAFDLGIRDLRKLITSTMDDMGVWDVTWMKGMIDAYSKANPIEPALYQVLLIDMSLPNEFYKHVKAGVTKIGLR